MDVPITHRRDPGAGPSVYETGTTRAHAYFEFRDHAAGLPARGPRARPGHAPPHQKRPPAISPRFKGENALRLEDGGADWILVPVAALARGRPRCWCAPASARPPTARSSRDQAPVDESAITGETEFKTGRAGDDVYAGTVNGEGALTVDVTAAGHSALIDEAARLIEQAGAARSRYMQLSDRVSQLYAPAVHLAALATGWSGIFSSAPAPTTRW